MGDKEIFKYEDIILRDSDLDTLRGPCFLNDQIIAFYFAYLSSSLDAKSHHVLLVTPSMSLLVANSEDDKVVEEYVQSCEISNKRLVLFVVNDNDDFSGGDSGNHWSLLVYDRAKNVFLHFDSMEEVNNFHALKLYDAVKEHVGPGGEVLRPETSLSSRKKQRNKKKDVVVSLTGGAKASAPAGLPVFLECKTPQQSNGYDCGLYVLAIAREICQWCSHERNKRDMISVIEKNVDYSVEMNMRSEVLKIIDDMR